eukprot:jgi/Antlo1/137/1166
MNRTNEFHHFVASLELPQSKPPFSTVSSDLQQIAEEINVQLGFLERQDGYERFVTEKKMCKTLDLLEKYKQAASSLQTTPKNESETTHLKGLKTMLNSRYARMMMRYNSISKRQNEKAASDTKRRGSFSCADTEQKQSQVFLEDQEQRNDTLRKRMLTQMNELGQIVTDISLHVSFQEEEIKRIDDLVSSSEGLIKESFFEIHRVWERISRRRRRMLKFFSAWIMLALFFWYFRR